MKRKRKRKENYFVRESIHFILLEFRECHRVKLCIVFHKSCEFPLGLFRVDPAFYSFSVWGAGASRVACSVHGLTFAEEVVVNGTGRWRGG